MQWGLFCKQQIQNLIQNYSISVLEGPNLNTDVYRQTIMFIVADGLAFSCPDEYRTLSNAVLFSKCQNAPFRLQYFGFMLNWGQIYDFLAQKHPGCSYCIVKDCFAIIITNIISISLKWSAGGVAWWQSVSVTGQRSVTFLNSLGHLRMSIHPPQGGM